MNREEIWEFALKHHIGSRRVMRQFLRLAREDFEVIKPYLKPTFHPMNPYEINYRSLHIWRHFHATESQGVFEIHWDFANPSQKLFLTAIPHVFIEVIPYLLCKIYCWFFDRLQLYPKT